MISCETRWASRAPQVPPMMLPAIIASVCGQAIAPSPMKISDAANVLRAVTRFFATLAER
jgi:hypothetical protein